MSKRRKRWMIIFILLDNFEIPAQACNVCRYIVDEVEGVGLCWNVPEYRLIDLSQWSVLGPRDCCTMGVMVHTVTL